MPVSDIDRVYSEPDIFDPYFTGGVIDGITTDGYVSDWDAMTYKNCCSATTALGVATDYVKFREKQFRLGVQMSFLKEVNVGRIAYEKVVKERFTADTDNGLNV